MDFHHRPFSTHLLFTYCVIGPYEMYAWPFFFAVSCARGRTLTARGSDIGAEKGQIKDSQNAPHR